MGGGVTRSNHYLYRESQSEHRKMLFRKVAIALTVFLAGAWAQTPAEEVEPDSGALLQESEKPQNGEQSEQAEALLEKESQFTASADEGAAADSSEPKEEEESNQLTEEEDATNAALLEDESVVESAEHDNDDEALEEREDEEEDDEAFLEEERSYSVGPHPALHAHVVAGTPVNCTAHRHGICCW